MCKQEEATVVPPFCFWFTNHGYQRRRDWAPSADLQKVQPIFIYFLGNEESLEMKNNSPLCYLLFALQLNGVLVETVILHPPRTQVSNHKQ